MYNKNNFLFRVMYKGKDEPSTALVKDRIYEFESSDIETALILAGSVGERKDWRLVLIAEVSNRVSTQNWDDLVNETRVSH